MKTVVREHVLPAPGRVEVVLFEMTGMLMFVGVVWALLHIAAMT